MTRHKRLINDYSSPRYLQEAKKQELAATYHHLNPVVLLKQINENLESLWNLAEHPTRQHKKAKTYKALVT
jgi:hypothetical protein